METECLLPMEKRIFVLDKDNGNIKYPGVHKCWCIKRSWVKYLNPDVFDTKSNEDKNATLIWMERSAYVLKDLETLLGFSHHIFWSQIVFDAVLHHNLDHMLQILPRKHDFILMNCDETIVSRINDIKHRLFFVFVRLSTNRESKSSFIETEYFANIIYTNYIFDIPRIMDICVLFGESNLKLTSKMISNLFNIQPKYLEDLRFTCRTICDAFSAVAERISILSKNVTLYPDSAQLTELDDIVKYVTDISASICSLTETYSGTVHVLHSAEFFELQIGNFYQSTLVSLCSFIGRLSLVSALQTKIKQYVLSLNYSRDYCIRSFRQILSGSCIVPLLEVEALTNKTAVDFVNDYMFIVTNSLGDVDFMKDYDCKFPIEDDLDIISQNRYAEVSIDPMRVEFVLNGLRSLKGASVCSSSQFKCVTEQPSKILEPVLETNAEIPNDIQINSLVTHVQDMLGDFDTRFIRECLVEFQFDVEKTINGILDNSIPERIQKMDKQPVVPERFNVYDGDEFDTNKRDDIDLSRVHRGKHSMNEFKDANSILNDKSDLDKEKFKSHFFIYDSNDDEYDDTYDDLIFTKTIEVGTEENLRTFVLPQALGGGHYCEYTDDDEKDKEGKSTEARNTNEFIQNPAEIRAAAERRHEDKMAKRNGYRQKNFDVVGNAKGQGQTKNVMINRARKNANKGKNFRAAADRKQSKGMF